LHSLIYSVCVFKVKKGLKGKVDNITAVLNLVVNRILVWQFSLLKACRYKATHLIIGAIIIAIYIANSIKNIIALSNLNKGSGLVLTTV